jgi:hypothetical protein
MEAVKDPVNERGKEQPCDADENQATEEGIRRGK